MLSLYEVSVDRLPRCRMSWRRFGNNYLFLYLFRSNQAGREPAAGGSESVAATSSSGDGGDDDDDDSDDVVIDAREDDFESFSCTDDDDDETGQTALDLSNR